MPAQPASLSGASAASGDIIRQIEAEQIAKLEASRPIPAFGPGDTVRVAVKVVEGERTRIQNFEGVVIARRNRDPDDGRG